MATLRLRAPEGAHHVTLPAGTVYADADGYLVLTESDTEEGQQSPERALLQAIAEQYRLGEIQVKPTGKGKTATKSDVAQQPAGEAETQQEA